MRSFRGAWSLAGLVAGLAGLATSYFAAMALTIRDSPVVAVAEGVIRLTPGFLAERAIGILGSWDKPVLLLGIFVVLAALFAWAGRLAARQWWYPVVLYAVLAGLGALAIALQNGSSALDYLPLAVGSVTWLLALSLLTDPLRRSVARDEQAADDVTEPTRRGFLVRTGVLALGAVALATAGRFVGSGRRRVEETRRLLKLSGVTEPRVPAGARIGLAGVSPWQTPDDEFYLIHTAIVIPTIEPSRWMLRIHGRVDTPLELSYEDLLARRRTEAWVTLNCVSNTVGGNLVGNAWWSGVRLDDLLAEAGVQPEADAVLQRSEDGWTCGTPLAALRDGRDAMLAVAMNGRPLPIEHGFPVRTIVPGLYGFVSACKWVVDLEVTRFDEITAYWTDKGWSEQGPVKIASRIDVPRSGTEVEAGEVAVGGVAWMQHTGISSVQVQVDGGPWLPTQLARVPSVDTWVQWATTINVPPGDHLLRVRATDREGNVQTGVERDVLPDGATGWHTVDFSVQEA